MTIRATTRAVLAGGLVLAASLIAAGCGGGGGLDTTDEKTVEASIKSLTAGMDTKDKAEFNRDLGAIMDQNRGKGPDTRSALLKPADGMSVQQIHAMAQDIRASKKKP